MKPEDKNLIITDSHTKPESHLAFSGNVKEREGSFVQNPIEGAISRQEFESRSAVLKRDNDITL